MSRTGGAGAQLLAGLDGVAHGSVAISSTDSISSGLMSPFGAPWSIDSIMLTRSNVSASQIISSSSMPIV